MNKNNNEQEDLEKIAVNLFRIEKKEVFTTPENYFDQLPGIMQSKVHAKKSLPASWVPNYKLALAAASICLFVFISIKFWNKPQASENEIAASEIVQTYDAQYLASSDESDLVEQLDDESIEITSQQLEQGNELSNMEIEEYLLSNNIDIQTLTNEF